MFPKRLALAFKESGIPKADLAKHLGTHPARVSVWLSGKYLPRTSTLVKIAAYLNVSVEWLIGED